MNDSDREMFQIFQEESLDHLDDIEQDLLTMEKTGARCDAALLNKVFRAVHSVKGGAGFIGLKSIQTLAHKMENVLGMMRSRKLTPDSENIHQLLLAADRLKEMMLHPERGRQADISSIVEGLDAVAENIESPPDGGGESHRESSGAPPVDVSRGDAEPSPDPSFVERAAEEGKRIYLLRWATDGRTVDELDRYGTAAPADTDAAGRPRMFFASILAPEDLLTLFSLAPEDLCALDEENRWICAGPSDHSGPDPMDEENISDTPANGERAPRAGADSRPQQIPGEPPVTETTPPTETGAGPTSIRVNLSLLDKLMAATGELVLTRNQLLRTISNNPSRTVQRIGKGLDAITAELQETVLLTRMQPVEHLFRKFPRVVRDLAKELGKEISVEISGEDVELDRTLMEHLSESLTHLVRNAVDHGIETAAERKERGKPEAGTIFLAAFQEADQVVLEIRDDGRGLDMERILEAALERGMVTPEQATAMGEKEKTALIFHPGFSTAQHVSDLSGRGVGMDVVRSNLNRLGGTVDVRSTPREGMRFRIHLPLTVAIIPSLIVCVEDQKFALPRTRLEELLRIPAHRIKDRIEVVGDAQVVRRRGDLLPLVHLADVLEMKRTYIDPATRQRRHERRDSIADRRSRKSPAQGSKTSRNNPHAPPADAASRRMQPDRRYRASSALNIAVISSGMFTYGLVVDAFCDSEEIVVKPLGRHLQTLRTYAGATILGEGRVALILDAAGIAGRAALSARGPAEEPREGKQEGETTGDDKKDRMPLLVFSNAPTERFAVPLNQVVRIEKIPLAAIESYGSQRTMPYRGGSLRLISIDEAAAVSPAPDLPHRLVLVLKVGGLDVGLLATGPVDAVTAEAPAEAGAFQQPGILGALVIDGRTTLLVDVYDLVQQIHPDWMPAADAETGREGKTLLVAEDSAFFRTHIKEFLQGKGYTVIEGADGKDAWDLLEARGEDIALVITDIEMPRMDGLALAGRIRSDDRFQNMPIIALTTLADEADEKRGRAAGIDDYLIKLDKEQLVKSIEAHIQHNRPFG